MTREPLGRPTASGAFQAPAVPPGQRKRQLLTTAHRITVETVVEGEAVERFYALYVDAFAPLRTEAVARHVLHEDEFLEEMVNPLVDKYVAWDADGRAIALATLTRHMETVPWIEPEYFAHRFPDAAARDAVFYLGFILVDRAHRRSKLFSEITEAVIRRVVDSRGVCGWDICAFNNRTVGLSEVVKSLSDSVAPIDVEVLDTQTYYCGIPEVSRPTAAPEPGTPPQQQRRRQGGW
jgi:hypothetical protein